MSSESYSLSCKEKWSANQIDQPDCTDYLSLYLCVCVCVWGGVIWRLASGSKRTPMSKKKRLSYGNDHLIQTSTKQNNQDEKEDMNGSTHAHESRWVGQGRGKGRETLVQHAMTITD